jgi:hypothetical protein
MWLPRTASSAGVGLAKCILGIIVLGCICISAFFAYQFGFGKAAVESLGWAYGAAGAGLDLLKAALPIIAVTSHTRSRRALAWIAFTFLTFMSLWCSFGTTAGQLAERIANKAVALTASKEKTDKLDRLHHARDALGTFTRSTPETIKAAEDAVASAVKAVAQECGDGTGRNCRDRQRDEREARAVLLKAQIEETTTAKADNLDQQIADEEAVKIDVKIAAKDVDPQAESLAKATGIDEAKIALISHIIFAVGIEIGSGLGLWLVFGHGGEAPAPGMAPSVTPPVLEPVEDEEDAAKRHRKRFFATCVFHTNGKAPAAIVHGAYLVWCRREGIANPMGTQAFGTQSPWAAKKRIGGIVHYLNCGIAPDLIRTSAPTLRIVAS